MPIPDDGPFTDDMIRGMIERRNMQAEIIPHIEEMARKLAAAGVASHLVTGDGAHYAVERWLTVLRVEALRLLDQKLREARAVKQLSANEAAEIEYRKRPDRQHDPD